MLHVTCESVINSIMLCMRKMIHPLLFNGSDSVNVFLLTDSYDVFKCNQVEVLYL